ncbi:hypothetical protein ABIE76_005756 [Sinorhizobium fredii]
MRGTPGDPGRQRIHQNRARIAGGAARDVKPHRIDRRPARAEADAHPILVEIILRHLPAVMRLDAGRRNLQSTEHFRLDRGDRSVDLGRADRHGRDAEIHAVEAGGIIGERRVAAGADVVDDGAHHGVDVFGNLPLGGQERGEVTFEAAIEKVQPDCQCDDPLAGGAVLLSRLRDGAA